VGSEDCGQCTSTRLPRLVIRTWLCHPYVFSLLVVLHPATRPTKLVGSAAVQHIQDILSSVCHCDPYNSTRSPFFLPSQRAHLLGLEPSQIKLQIGLGPLRGGTGVPGIWVPRIFRHKERLEFGTLGSSINSVRFGERCLCLCLMSYCIPWKPALGVF
jgi:hypothetical protein